MRVSGRCFIFVIKYIMLTNIWKRFVLFCHCPPVNMQKHLQCIAHKLNGGVLEQTFTACVSEREEGACSFGRYHKDGCPSCFTATHAVPAESKVHLHWTQRVNGRAWNEWTSCLVSLSSCVERTPITPPFEGTHTYAAPWRQIYMHTSVFEKVRLELMP